MAPITLARHAMATRFEAVLYGDNPVAVRAAGEEALDEIDRLETRLSLFRPTSEIAHLNARAAHEPVRVTPEIFRLLQHAQKLNRETSGVFDITIAPLVRCWGFMGGNGHVPAADDLSRARACVGMDLVHLNETDFTAEFEREGVMLDLGAIGKGYAIERAAELLREAGIQSGLLHGGTSTVYAIGAPPGAMSWKVAIADPRRASESYTGSVLVRPAISADVRKDYGPKGDQAGDARKSGPSFATVELRDESLSVSAIWGKYFRADGQVLGHILDPRTGRPAAGAVLSAVILPSATETDALSTALLTLGPAGHQQITGLRPGMRTLVAGEIAGQLVTRTAGICV